ncbi:MAG: signal peptidase I [Candidatus Kapaibacterium sp.]
MNQTDHTEESVEAGGAVIAGEEKSPSDAFRKLLWGTGYSLLGLLILRTFVFAPYAIPTRSMEPTILSGDAVLINQLPYYIRTPEFFPFTHWPIPHLELGGLGSLERGDIVLFRSPELYVSEDHSTLFKRAVALPGDTVALVEGVIVVNGREPEPLSLSTVRREPMDVKKAWPLLRKRKMVIVPYKGYELPLDSITAEAWKDVLYAEGVNVTYKNRIVFINGGPATRYRFKQDYFFALGDNSANSRDSRHFGFIPYENLIGEAIMIFWSSGEDGIRWGRIGKRVE